MFKYSDEWVNYNPKANTNYYSEAFEISVYDDRYVFFKRNNGDMLVFPPAINQTNVISNDTVRILIKSQMCFDYKVVRESLGIKETDYEIDKLIKRTITQQLAKTVLKHTREGESIPIDGRYMVEFKLELSSEELMKYLVDVNGKKYLISNYFGFLIAQGMTDKDFIDPFDQGYIFSNERKTLDKDLTSVRYKALRGSIFLVDRVNKFRNLYMNVLGNIVRIPVTHISEDNKLEDGLYIKDNSNLVYGNGGKFTPINQIDKQFLNNLSIYTSYEECKNNNLEYINKEQKSKIDKLSKENSSLKAELDKLKTKIEEDKLRADINAINDRITGLLVEQQKSINNILNKVKSYKADAKYSMQAQYLAEGFKTFSALFKLVK